MDKRGEAPLLIQQGEISEKIEAHQSFERRIDGGWRNFKKISNYTAEVWTEGCEARRSCCWCFRYSLVLRFPLGKFSLMCENGESEKVTKVDV